MRSLAITTTIIIVALSDLVTSAAMATEAHKPEPVAAKVPVRVPDKSYNARVRCPDRPNVTENFYFSAPNDIAAMQEANRRLRDNTSFQGRGCQVISLN